MPELQKYLSLRQVAEAIPMTENGKPINVVTVWRWCRDGIRGVKLEHLRLGNRLVVTPDALAAFGRALADLGPARYTRRAGKAAQ